MTGRRSAAARKRRNKVVNIHATTQLKVVLVKPERFENASEIADHLREKRTVVLEFGVHQQATPPAGSSTSSSPASPTPGRQASRRSPPTPTSPRPILLTLWATRSTSWSSGALPYPWAARQAERIVRRDHYVHATGSFRKTFPKSSSFSSGYDLAAVDEFLDTLTEDYTALYKENAALKTKLKILRKSGGVPGHGGYHALHAAGRPEAVRLHDGRGQGKQRQNAAGRLNRERANASSPRPGMPPMCSTATWLRKQRRPEKIPAGQGSDGGIYRQESGYVPEAGRASGKSSPTANCPTRRSGRGIRPAGSSRCGGDRPWEAAPAEDAPTEVPAAAEPAGGGTLPRPQVEAEQTQTFEPVQAETEFRSEFKLTWVSWKFGRNYDPGK